MTSKMYIEDRFECSATKLLELTLDSDYETEVMAAIGMKREVLEEREIEGGRFVVIRFTPSTELPSFMKKVVGGSNDYVETRTWNFEKMMNDWSEKTGFAQDKIDIKGTFVITPAGEGACTRIVDGDFTVRIPLVGKKIEEFIIERTKESFRRSTDFTRKWLKDKGLEGA